MVLPIMPIQDHVAYAELLQLQVEIGIGESTGVPMLVDDDVLGPWLKVVMECATPCPLGKGLSFGPSELVGGWVVPFHVVPRRRAPCFSQSD